MKKNLLGLFLGIFVTVALFFGSPVTSAFAGLSGTCGMLASPPPSPGTNAFMYNVLAVVDFSTSTISYNVTTLTFGNSPPPTLTQSSNSSPFTLGSGPISGSYTMTFTPQGSNTALIFNLFPVNSNNTILVQGANSPFSGVCQMQ
jgi:hypothetical protein